MTMAFICLISAFRFYFTFEAGTVILIRSCFTAHRIYMNLVSDAALWASPWVLGVKLKRIGISSARCASGNVGASVEASLSRAYDVSKGIIPG